MSIASTVTDLLLYQWAIDDAIIQLREWGTNRTHTLTGLATSDGKIVIGRGPRCQIRSDDARVSARHAELEQQHGHWIITNRSKNGLCVDGELRDQAALVAGMEVRCGGLILVAESVRFIVLRKTLARMLGWAAQRRKAIDLALRTIRFATTQRTPILLCGGHDLIPLAIELHELTLGDRPFVMCRAERLRDEPTVKCIPSGLEALAAATNGTVCLEGTKPSDLPRDLIAMLVQQRQPTSTTQLIVCQEHAHERDMFPGMPIELPAWSSRRQELDHIIDDCAAAAAGRFRMAEYVIADEERAWIRKEASRSLAEVRRATTRLAALRSGRSWRGAADILGMDHKSLREWFGSRRFPGINSVGQS